ncbi:MAG: enoyl-CoA hydratase/isomerase family protein [Pseudomonadota bacterium]
MNKKSSQEPLGDFVSLHRNGRVVEVRFDRGDGLNALSVKAMTELRDVARRLADDADSSVIVLKGGKTFSAGADLSDPLLRGLEEKPIVEQRTIMRLGPDMCQAWADLEQITIAAINGACVGGGLALAVSCDHRVASSDALFRLPEVPLGMNMSWRSVPRLAALLGPSRAKELIILGRKIKAEAAKDWGLVDRVAVGGTALDAAHELASEYALLPPLALRMAKQAIDVSVQPLAFATSFMDRDQFLLTRGTQEQADAISAFLEKRKPKVTST